MRHPKKRLISLFYGLFVVACFSHSHSFPSHTLTETENSNQFPPHPPRSTRKAHTQNHPHNCASQSEICFWLDSSRIVAKRSFHKWSQAWGRRCRTELRASGKFWLSEWMWVDRGDVSGKSVELRWITHEWKFCYEKLCKQALGRKTEL